jgi:hypothetical protein
MSESSAIVFTIRNLVYSSFLRASQFCDRVFEAGPFVRESVCHLKIKPIVPVSEGFSIATSRK